MSLKGIMLSIVNQLQEDKILYVSIYSSHRKYLEVFTVVMQKAMAPHSSTLAWKIPWTEEPGRLQSIGSPRVGHD